MVESSLILLAYKLNQILDSLLFPAFFIYWDGKQEKWKLLEREKRIKLLPYLITSFGIVGILTNTCWIFTLATTFISPDILSLEQAILFAFLGLGIPTAVGCDILVLLYGNEIVTLTNWHLHLNDEPVKITKYSVSHDVLKTWRGETHWIGLLLLCVVTCYCILATVISVTIVFFSWDPLYLALTAASKILNVDASFVSTAEVVGLRYILSFAGIQAMFVNYRALFMTTCLVGVSTVAILKRMDAGNISSIMISEFKILHVSLAQIYGMGKYLFGGFLTIGFITLVVGPSVAVYSARVMANGFVTFVTSFFVFVLFFIICFSFDIGCSINERTVKMKQKWQKDLKEYSGLERKILRRQIRAYRALGLPVGSVGILDKEIKINYLHHILIHNVDLVLLIDNAV
ncbi:unnamed protein product [Orchesella dallaii]|uniref:Uncharacterized protein n=1 Tax=Orchesella dallaii TaxID=48710 RepID=A0ABP1S1S6_9HEXA